MAGEVLITVTEILAVMCACVLQTMSAGSFTDVCAQLQRAISRAEMQTRSKVQRHARSVGCCKCNARIQSTSEAESDCKQPEHAHERCEQVSLTFVVSAISCLGVATV